MRRASDRWRSALAEWAIPDHITAAVTESPWVVPTEVFARRADQYVAQPTGRSWERASEALAPRGSVLDVGAGAGAASLPLASLTSELTAVDVSDTMLAALTERADKLGLATRTIVGRWPDVAPEVPPADVVLCHHVFYNAPDLDAFAAALHDHARRRVVVELPARHPMFALNPLWNILHTTGPTDGADGRGRGSRTARDRHRAARRAVAAPAAAGVPIVRRAGRDHPPAAVPAGRAHGRARRGAGGARRRSGASARPRLAR